MKLLHTADWQIGRLFETMGPEDGPALAEARLDCVQRIAALATESGCDAVLVAGDVFDAQTVSERTLRRLFNQLEGFAGPWVLLPGNHDAALAESVWTRAQRLRLVADNVHLALQPQPLEFPDLGLAVLPAPLVQRHTHEDLTAWFDGAVTDASLFRIGLAHGSVQGILPDEIDSPNPIAPTRAQSARLDYLALGDWHGCRQVDARTWYSGTPEPDRFRSRDAGQVLLVELEKPGAEPRVTAQTVGQYAWQQWQRELRIASDLDALLAELSALSQPGVLDLRLQGQLDLAGRRRLQEALDQAEARHRSLRCNLAGLQVLASEAELAELKVDGYVAEVVAALRQRQQEGGESAAVARDALLMLLRLLDRQGPGQGEAKP